MTHKREGGSKRTVVETTFRIVCWALGVPAEIIPFDCYIVRVQLIPDHHLLRPLHTLARIILAPDRHRRISDRLSRRRVRNHLTPVGEHVYVWFTTAIWNL